MKKTILWATIVLGMLGVLFVGSPSVNAATWHQGVPTFLKSGFWHENKPKDSYIKFSNRGIYYIFKEDNIDVYEGMVATDSRYKKTGKIYIIDNKISKTRHIMSTVRRTSKNKAIFHMNEKGGDHINTHITRISKLP
ncbi:hypothetical protein [Lentilactobacillus sp. SPB1-3]|uniref:Uncharacterized protein n=1 Tax=Lentilactobacillus terminaliae TaxID=3003483 RepID=A0ACD5DDV2_9LACO|nr:hypothetical protein [Lentilactobacillus sp. SPB1-3]MCZ0977454.1 hypothetical protein [Lentilactobacillus sp. SPB1-3]